jgi:hypothetical protein
MEFENSCNPDNPLDTAAVFAHREAERGVAADEKSAASPFSVGYNPVGFLVLANEEELVKVLHGPSRQAADY